MRLLSIEYAEHEGTPQEWSLKGLTLGAKNLIVGKNSTGKTRALNIINALAKHLAGIQNPLLSGTYDACFAHKNKIYQYALRYKDQKVLNEKLTIDGFVVLDRGEGGKGTIYAEKIDSGTHIEFQSPTSSIAVVARRDEIQHSYLEPLYSWASALRHYPFSSYLGKEQAVIIIPNGPIVDDRDHNASIGVFREAKKTFGKAFINALIQDFSSIDYHVDEIDVASPISVQFEGAPGEPVGLYVKESNLPGITDQYSMSVGMFRVLSLLIHINYFQLRKSESSILVDDIGEGLDFDRSCRLIDLLRKKADENDLQIILSTNDKYVMNSVPLEEWSVLNRKANRVEVKNYSNSKDIFEEFKYTGLSNFSFLELDVINEQKESN